MFYEKTENLHFCDKLLIHFVPVIIRLNAVLKCTHSQILETAHEYKEIQGMQKLACASCSNIL